VDVYLYFPIYAFMVWTGMTVFSKPKHNWEDNIKMGLEEVE